VLETIGPMYDVAETNGLMFARQFEMDFAFATRALSQGPNKSVS